MTILRNVGVALIPLVACAQMATAQQISPPLDRSLWPKATLTLTPVLDTVKVGSPVKVKVNLKNIWDRNIVFGNDYIDVWGAFVVRDESGNLAPETRRGYFRNPHWEHKPAGAPGPEPKAGSSDFNGGGSATLGVRKVGESWDAVQDVTILYDLTKPGKYTIQMEKLIGPPEVPRAFTPVRSNIVTVTVID